ncbi:O-methyltransferase [Cytophagales bacterium LB-30]|uniref:O-methyltransferase n=1 Tax=Shiella aurantiaca TaxID=3058365 RepID=A0ABT8F6T9_9BACT|nr:O-methyltransferase [Shiella aurantiaca]MDN4165954.1 O-methyltransferase [Shiella aurantiaca]
MEFIDSKLQDYIEAHTEAESALLAKLNRETHAKVLMPRMLSGHLQGRVLAMLSHMISPKRILEIGTYTGYSAICMAEGLAAGGSIDTIDINEELETWLLGYFEEAGLADKIQLHIGDARQIVTRLEGPYDLVFIDADKENYSTYFDLVYDKVRTGGFVIADNVLWSGKVVATDKKIDKDTQALLDFNKKMHDDPRVENVLFPIRDGLMVLRKR